MFSNRKVQDPETCVWYGGVPMADEILKLATASLILQYNRNYWLNHSLLQCFKYIYIYIYIYFFLKIIMLLKNNDRLHPCVGLAVTLDWYLKIRLENLTKYINYVLVCNPIRLQFISILYFRYKKKENTWKWMPPFRIAPQITHFTNHKGGLHNKLYSSYTYLYVIQRITVSHAISWSFEVNARHL